MEVPEGLGAGVGDVDEEAVLVAGAHQRPADLGEAAVAAAAAGAAGAAVALPQRAEPAHACRRPGAGPRPRAPPRPRSSPRRPRMSDDLPRRAGGRQLGSGVAPGPDRRGGPRPAAGLIQLPPEAAAGVQPEAGEHGAAEGVDAGRADLGEIEIEPEGVPERGRRRGGWRSRSEAWLILVRTSLCRSITRASRCSAATSSETAMGAPIMRRRRGRRRAARARRRARSR